MLSVEEIKLIIEKLEKANSKDLTKMVEGTLATFKELAHTLDIYNEGHIKKFDKPVSWFQMDVERKRKDPVVDPVLFKQIQQKIFNFAKSNAYNSLEIGPGTGMFSKEFRAWRLNYYLDIMPELEPKIRRRFPPQHQKYLKFFTTKRTDCSNIPQGSCNFVFSWDTFPFFSQDHIREYLNDIKRVMIKGAYGFIQYSDCHYDYDLEQAKRGYWNFNTKTKMKKILVDSGSKVVEMAQFRSGANYVIFKKPGNLNPVVYKHSELTLD